MVVLLGCFKSTVLAQDTLFSKPTTVYSSLKARKYKIILATRRIIAAHSLDSLNGNTLYISGKNGPLVSLKIMKELQVAKRKRLVARGLGLEALSGLAVGALTGLSTYQRQNPNAYFTFDLGPGAAAGAGAIIGALGGVWYHHWCIFQQIYSL